MAHMERYNESTASNWRLSPLVLCGTATVIASVRKRWQGIITRNAMAALTPEQQDDIGYPEAPLAKLEIKAGLITNLMSLR